MICCRCSRNGFCTLKQHNDAVRRDCDHRTFRIALPHRFRCGWGCRHISTPPVCLALLPLTGRGDKSHTPQSLQNQEHEAHAETSPTIIFFDICPTSASKCDSLDTIGGQDSVDHLKCCDWRHLVAYYLLSSRSFGVRFHPKQKIAQLILFGCLR